MLKSDLAVNGHLDEEDVKGTQRRRLTHGDEAAVDPVDDNDGEQKLPPGGPYACESSRCLRPIGWGPGEISPPTAEEAVCRQSAHEEEPGDNAGNEQLIDWCFRDNPVENESDAGRKEEPDTAGSRQQSERELLLIPRLLHGRKQQAPDSDDRHPRGTGKCG